MIFGEINALELREKFSHSFGRHKVDLCFKTCFFFKNHQLKEEERVRDRFFTKTKNTENQYAYQTAPLAIISVTTLIQQVSSCFSPSCSHSLIVAIFFSILLLIMFDKREFLFRQNNLATRRDLILNWRPLQVHSSFLIFVIHVA